MRWRRAAQLLARALATEPAQGMVALQAATRGAAPAARCECPRLAATVATSMPSTGAYSCAEHQSLRPWRTQGVHTAAALRARRRGPAAGAQQAPAGTAGPSSHPDSSPSPGNSPPPGAAARASSNPAGDPGPNPGHNPGVGPLREEVDGFGEHEPGAFEDSEDFGDSVDLEGMELEVEEGDEEDDALPDLAAIGPTIDTGDTDWGPVAVEVAQGVLDTPAMASLELFLLRARSRQKFLEIRLDQMEDRYGSASLEDIQAFSRAFAAAMEAHLGEQRAGEIETEVSSVGAERPVRLPGELERFKGLPMRVVFAEVAVTGAPAADKVLQLLAVDHAGATSEWALANVRANRGQGRAKLSARAARERWTLPLSALQRVNLYLDM